jgi:hypothetical protein
MYRCAWPLSTTVKASSAAAEEAPRFFSFVFRLRAPSNSAVMPRSCQADCIDFLWFRLCDQIPLNQLLFDFVGLSYVCEDVRTQAQYRTVNGCDCVCVPRIQYLLDPFFAQNQTACCHNVMVYACAMCALLHVNDALVDMQPSA